MQSKPIAAVFLFTDGNATDIAKAIRFFSHLSSEQKNAPKYRIYPYYLREPAEFRDLAISQINVSVADFETSPVSLRRKAKGLSNQRRKRNVTSL